MWWTAASKEAMTATGKTAGGVPVSVRIAPPLLDPPTAEPLSLHLHLQFARLKLLRSFENLLCLEGLHGVEQLPHQVETVRKVLRHFRGRVLLADEVGLGKTIEACLLLREYLLRGLVRRVLILTPAALVSQWREELSSKFSLEFAVASPASGTEFWAGHDLSLASLSLAKSRKHFEAVTGCPWDLVIVDEAHHCKRRTTRNWQLVNALPRRHLFLLTATPVQNDLLELYNLLTLLEPGHLKTEREFKKSYVRRGHPRDPRNRERLRSLLSEVMVRNTRSLVNVSLPPRYAQTIVVAPRPAESRFYQELDCFLRRRSPTRAASFRETEDFETDGIESQEEPFGPTGTHVGCPLPLWSPGELSEVPAAPTKLPADEGALPCLTRMQVNSLLLAAGSHPVALRGPLARLAQQDDRARALLEPAGQEDLSAKEERLLELLRQNHDDKTLVFANFLATLERLSQVLAKAGISFCVFSGSLSASAKAQVVEEFRMRSPVMLCSESGGEGHNLQFARTLINFDLPWNPMRIEQRVGRIHRIGQTREVFVFNLCTADSLEERILRVLNDKIRMFELVVGEVGSILGNLEGGEEFESLVLDLWLRHRNKAELDAAFERLGESLLRAQETYQQAKELDEALFGEDYE